MLKWLMLSLLVLFSNLAVPVGASVESARCKTELVGELSTEKNSEYNQPELRVTFHDGRRLFLYGHNHGDPEKSMALLRLILRRKDFSDRQFEFSANLYRQDHQVALASFHRELPKLRTLLAGSGIKFVALEQPPIGVENNLKSVREVYDLASKAFDGREFSAEMKKSIIEDLLLVQFGPVFTLQLLEPEKFRGVEILGAEDLKQMQDANTEVEELSLAYTNALETFRKNGDEAAASIFVREIEAFGLQEMALEDMTARLDAKLGHRKTPNHVWIPALVSVRKMAVSTRQRNETIFKNLVDRGESGALFIGAAHITGLQKIFQDYCSTP